MRIRPVTIAALAITISTTVWLVARWDYQPRGWSEEGIAVLESLWLEALPDLPPDPTNAVADDPRAVEFGRRLFFDTRFSANGAISCATCHQPERHFTDGLPKGVAIGVSKRNTPSIVGTAYSPWFDRDGRRDSQWSQALSHLEDPNEHAVNRLTAIAIVVEDKDYWRMYKALFGEASSVDTMFSNIGKAIAAFERTILPTPSRFDRYVAAVVAGDATQQAALFTDEEVRGLRLFIGEAHCTQCHNGPLLTNNEFHNTGLANFEGEVPDKGRVAGIRTPSLRNLGNTAPYGHQGQVATLADMLAHYNEAPDAMIGHNETTPLGLSKRELAYLEAFLRTLAAPSSYSDR